jgi:hypothetical protein
MPRRHKILLAICLAIPVAAAYFQSTHPPAPAKTPPETGVLTPTQQAAKANADAPAEPVRKITAAERKLFIEELEKEFLARGMDVELKVSGRENTTLTMRYVFINRPFVYQMMNDPKVFASKRADGFTKVIFTDGYFKTWTCDLAAGDCR